MNIERDLEDLIKRLDPEIEIPPDLTQRWRLYRSLVNVRMPGEMPPDYMKKESHLLQAVAEAKGVTDFDELEEMETGIYLWQGDITTLRIDAIVNAANSQMLGCFCPCHGCIDNAIHTFAGVGLRNECAEIMRRQGHLEETGGAKITSAYNLPAKFVIHTVGPIISDAVRERDKQALCACYESSMRLADRHGLGAIAFCCISTGEFHFPNHLAAEIAVETVRTYQKNSNLKVVFNVFKDQDLQIYEGLLGKNRCEEAGSK